MTEAKREVTLIQLMRDVCEDVGLPEEKDERCPILEALNVAFNLGCASRGESAAQPSEQGWVAERAKLLEVVKATKSFLVMLGGPEDFEYSTSDEGQQLVAALAALEGGK